MITREEAQPPRPPPEWFIRAIQEARINDWFNRQPWYIRFYLEARRRLGMSVPKWVKID